MPVRLSLCVYVCVLVIDKTKGVFLFFPRAEDSRLFSSNVPTFDPLDRWNSIGYCRHRESFYNDKDSNKRFSSCATAKNKVRLEEEAVDHSL